MRIRRNLLLAVALGAVVIAAHPAQADPSPDYPSACEGSKVTQADIDRAHTVFLSGKQFLEESNYDKAISYFKDAYSIDCSRHAMLPIIATAYERKGDKAEAVRALEEYLKRAPAAADHDVIERRIRNLRDQLAHEQAPPPPSPSSSAAASAPILAPPSAVTADSTTPTVNPPLPNPPPASPPPVEHAIGPWVVTGVGVAGTLAGVILVGVGAGDVSNAEKTCPGRVCPPGAQATSAQDQGNKGRGLENAGGIVIGGGVAVVAAGLLWHFLEKPADRSTGAAPGPAAALSPLVGPAFAGVSVGGRF